MKPDQRMNLVRVVFVAVNEMVATHFTVELVDNCGGSFGGTRGTRRSPVQIPPGCEVLSALKSLN